MVERFTKKTILIVDDASENIDHLKEFLRLDYGIRGATSGEMAIKIALSQNPDLILLDIMMPEMDGYEVCKKFKSIETTKVIPIIFVTTKSEIDDETKGLGLGAVDYITKPFVPAIVKARVATQLELKEARDDLQNLLKNTLMGSLKVMMDILSLLNPIMFSQASRLRMYTKQITKLLNIKNGWYYELAAMLSHIGCINLSAEILNKLYTGKTLTDREQKIFEMGSKIGYELLANIPKIETIADMILHQHDSVDKNFNSSEIEEEDPGILGGQILKIIIYFDQLITRGNSYEVALKQMKKDPNKFDPLILDALKRSLEIRELEMDVRILNVNELCEGMILDENIYSHKELLVVNKGTEITLLLLKKLQQFSSMAEINEPIRVLVPFKHVTI